MSTSETPQLFEFLATLGVAMLRKKVTGQQAGIALLVAITSRGVTGLDAVVDAERLALEADLSTRQVWRHFSALVDAGWFDQTGKPTRGEHGRRGRRARYRLTLPRLNLSHDDRLTSPHGETSHDSIEPAESCDTSTPNRVTFSPESCDIAEREGGTVLPSDGNPTDGNPCLGTTRTQPPDPWAPAPIAPAYLHTFDPMPLFTDRCALCGNGVFHGYHQSRSEVA